MPLPTSGLLLLLQKGQIAACVNSLITFRRTIERNRNNASSSKTMTAANKQKNYKLTRVATLLMRRPTTKSCEEHFLATGPQFCILLIYYSCFEKVVLQTGKAYARMSKVILGNGGLFV